ncbi:hypothetical protein SYNTR_0449 [Candidatus Syntrophocurvum alkaliphilum]|uniref:Uncharacterized protein n=1 Tax=Candidatus Syntrophocurvum alkaliphilum TaxID=2293317 RepID=A0A6I6DE49_9FIRM|nr:hypothetical protein [Candidatus Syntrophocurvum alkaliphilum]QGT99042.1 hypothetical protein SYNTR_0449 [Candidatus Syntrophocurvum alkaliphilum]
MKLLLTNEVNSDLIKVDRLFQYHLKPWWADISKYISEFEKDNTWMNLPSIVLVAYKYLNLDKDLTLSMTNMFKTAYLANRIHSLIKDEEEGQQYNQELQFNILIGDYICGKVLKLLLDAKADHFLQDFSVMMCELSEGMVIEHKLMGEEIDVLKKTKAVFYSTAFFTAANFAELNNHEQEIFSKIGLNIGFCLELLNRKSASEAIFYAHEAHKLLKYFEQRVQSKSSLLEKTLNDMTKHVEVANKAVV